MAVRSLPCRHVGGGGWWFFSPLAAMYQLSWSTAPNRSLPRPPSGPEVCPPALASCERPGCRSAPCRGGKGDTRRRGGGGGGRRQNKGEARKVQAYRYVYFYYVNVRLLSLLTLGRCMPVGRGAAVTHTCVVLLCTSRAARCSACCEGHDAYIRSRSNAYRSRSTPPLYASGASRSPRFRCAAGGGDAEDVHPINAPHTIPHDPMQGRSVGRSLG